MTGKRFGLANRRAVILLAVALIAVTLAMIFATFRTEPLKEFLVANRDLASGSLLSASDFTRVSTDLPVQGVYLSSLVPLATLKTPLRKGELLAVSALGPTESRYSVVLKPSQPLSSGIRVGSLVDVWFVAKPTNVAEAAVPQRIATSLEVLSVVEPSANDSFATDSVRLEVASSAEGLAALMLASAEGGFIGVVSNQ
jgi:hypothetical protein